MPGRGIVHESLGEVSTEGVHKMRESIGFRYCLVSLIHQQRPKHHCFVILLAPGRDVSMARVAVLVAEACVPAE